MQVDPPWTGARRPIQILGINQTGQESQNDVMTEGRMLPWLQDTVDQNVWDLWHVTWRDVVVLDARNRAVAVYNLTVHDLNRPAARDSLVQILQQAAQQASAPEAGF